MADTVLTVSIIKLIFKTLIQNFVVIYRWEMCSSTIWRGSLVLVSIHQISALWQSIAPEAVYR